MNGLLEATPVGRRMQLGCERAPRCRCCRQCGRPAALPGIPIADPQTVQRRLQLLDAVAAINSLVLAMLACDRGITGPRASAERRPSAYDTQASCRACNGEWGRFGITDEPRCLCRTHDAGRWCLDGEQCEGACLYDHRIEVPVPPICQGGLCTGVDVPDWVAVGRCSEFVAQFGCHYSIPLGWHGRRMHGYQSLSWGCAD